MATKRKAATKRRSTTKAAPKRKATKKTATRKAAPKRKSHLNIYEPTRRYARA